MIPYKKFFETVDFPKVIGECADGTIKAPLVTFKAPPEWYGYPPVMIPIWSDGSRPTYIGIWKHWFVNREPSYVKMYVGAGRSTIEVARTVEQLFALIAMMSISERDGIEKNLVVFAKEIGIHNLSEINSVSLLSGDEAKGLVMIEQFKFHTPLESLEGGVDYDGDFPSKNFDSSNFWWEKSCSFEIPDEVFAVWPVNLVKPAWLENSGKDKFELFREYLAADNFENAWLTLNSSGWTICDARVAISALSIKAKNAQFSVLADAWLSVADESAGGY